MKGKSPVTSLKINAIASRISMATPEKEAIHLSKNCIQILSLAFHNQQHFTYFKCLLLTLSCFKKKRERMPLHQPEKHYSKVISKLCYISFKFGC